MQAGMRRTNMFDLRLSLFLPALFMQVTSPYGDVLHHSDKVTLGQFAFTAAESGNYLACFKVETLERGMVVNLNLDWKTGIQREIGSLSQRKAWGQPRDD
jgi:hypothetical protein